MVAKNITVAEACYFLGMHRENFCNLVRRGDFADIADAVSARGEKNKRYYIKAAAFMAKYALTWDDIQAIREEMAAKAAPEEPEGVAG